MEDVMNDLTYAVDDYVAIMYSNKWYPCKVTEVIICTILIKTKRKIKQLKFVE